MNLDEATQPNNNPGSTFDPTKTHVLHQWKYERPVITCKFSPDGRFLFSSSEDNAIQRWDYATGQETPIKGHESWVRDFAFLDDGQTVVSAGCDETMMFWDVENPGDQPQTKVIAHRGWVRCLDSNGKDLVLSGGNDKLVKIWNRDGELEKEFAGHDSHVYSVMWHPDGQHVLSGDLSGNVHQWEIASGKLVRSFDVSDLHSYNTGQQVHYGGVRSLSLASDDSQLVCGGLHKASNPLGAVNEPIIAVFNWLDQKKLHAHVGEGIKGVVWRSLPLADGSLLGASGGSSGGYLLFWKPGEEKLFHQFKMPDTIRGMDVHPDGIHVATAHWDKHVRISRMSEKIPAESPKA